MPLTWQLPGGYSVTRSWAWEITAVLQVGEHVQDVVECDRRRSDITGRPLGVGAAEQIATYRVSTRG